MNKIESIELIKHVLEDMNDMLPESKQIDISVSDCLKNMDSLQIVNMIVALEEKIEEDFNKIVIFSLDGEENEASFLDSIDALSDFILKNINL
jgi:hypothetical protein